MDVRKLMMRSWFEAGRLSAPLALSLILIGCGGGSSNPPMTTPPASAPTLTIASSVKELQLSWGSVIGATSYKLFENPDGASGFTEVGSAISGTSTTVSITDFAFDWPNALFAVEACNSSGCSAMSKQASAQTAMLGSIGFFKPSNTKGNMVFGDAMAFSADGKTLAVGARGEASEATGINGNQTDTSQPDSGAVYVYTSTDGTWSQQAYVKASNSDAFYNFGGAVALSNDGNTLAVGSLGESGSSTGINGSQTQTCVQCYYGAVYIFTRSGSTWTQQAYIKAAVADAMQYFGDAVSLSGDGNALAVSIPGDASDATGINGNPNNSTDPGAGAVYVFTRSGSTWAQVAYVKTTNTSAGQGLGTSLALSNDASTLAVAAPGENAPGLVADPNNPPPPASGAIYIFTSAGGSWSQQAHLYPSNAQFGQSFGRAVALSSDGNALAVGATGDPSNATGLNGNQTDTSDFAAGATFLFTRSSEVWTQQAYVKPSNTQADQLFGSAVALSGDGTVLAVGAVGESSAAAGINGNQFDTSLNAAGAAYVFKQSSGQWAQLAYVKASNPRFSPSALNFGFALALDAAGDALAVSSPSEPSGATGIDGSQTDKSALDAGAVYVY
jgi:deoxycytidylate deaminase